MGIRCVQRTHNARFSWNHALLKPYARPTCCCRDAMAQLLQNSGGGASIPYMFLPGNHEVIGLGLTPWTPRPNNHPL